MLDREDSQGARFAVAETTPRGRPARCRSDAIFTGLNVCVRAPPYSVKPSYTS